MKFTNYYSNYIKSNGVPHMSVAQHSLLMNLVALESSLHQLSKLNIYGEEKLKVQKKQYQIYAQIYNLVKNQTPEQLFQEFFGNTISDSRN